MKSGLPVAAELSWADVHSFRLARHHLLERAPKSKLAQVVGDIGGAQAQVMSLAELQIAVRVSCNVEDVREALWKKRSLVKTWLMRGTLHLIPSADLPMFAAAMGAHGLRNLNTWLKYLQVDEAQLTKLFDSIGSALNGTWPAGVGPPHPQVGLGRRPQARRAQRRALFRPQPRPERHLRPSSGLARDLDGDGS